MVDLPVTIRREDTLRLLGYPEHRDPPSRIAARIDSALAEARRLAAARGAYLHLPVHAGSLVGLEVIEAAGLAIGLVTIGGHIEARVTECLVQDDATGALILDAAGSAAAEEAADRIGAIIAAGGPDVWAHRTTGGPSLVQASIPASSDRADEPSVSASCRISPGYGEWPLSAQRLLFDRLPADRIGVSLLPSMLMVPRKSISFAMWLGAEARVIAGLSGCGPCRLSGCSYRRAT